MCQGDRRDNLQEADDHFLNLLDSSIENREIWSVSDICNECDNVMQQHGIFDEKSTPPTLKAKINKKCQG